MLSYPHRVNVNVELLALRQDNGQDLRASAPFIQAWLWFGMIDEVDVVWAQRTGEKRCFNRSALIKSVSNTVYVSSKNLCDLLPPQNEDELPNLCAEECKNQLTRCIHVATNFIRTAVDTVLAPGLEVQESILPGIQLVLLSSQVLCQTLTQFLISPNGFPWIIPDAVVDVSQQSRIVDLLLRRAGWCPKDIYYLPRSLVFRYYLANLRQSIKPGGPDHLGIDGCNCKVTPDGLSDRPSVPLYTHPACRCGLVAVPGPRVDSGISRKEVPLFQFKSSGSQGASLELVELELPLEAAACNEDFDPTVRFVAISHVRSLGLGNDMENSLPYCQLSLIQSIANQVVKPSGAEQTTPFWIDTLCLPIDNASRKAVLPYLRKVFYGATTVLVLDPTLFGHIFTTSEEALIRIHYSMWKRRLWTLAEGFFAQKLVFRFANALVSLDDLLADFKHSSPSPTVLRIHTTPRVSSNIDNIVLSHVLGNFLSDIHTASRTGLTMDKGQLYEILRAGYLLERKFLYFFRRTRGESHDGDLVSSWRLTGELP